ncbi:uncharacterized protein LOC130054508 [Ostrea edulis]|uniref:uncharacterized protein LOC130054508 n=1 Tax=Ostrea edulis TaxID=37623 RepID=UPI0024AFF0A5|nr:uncharacterized protein LOC130054508 [Ostrea edulis]
MTDFNNIGYSEQNITSSFIIRTNTRRKPGNFAQRKEAQFYEKLCIFCNENHSPVNCSLDHNKKLEKIKMDKLRFICLGRHKVADCKSNKTYKRCNRRHHTSSRSSQVLLKTAVAEVQSRNGTDCQANIMFDEGSQRCFINQKLASELQLEIIGKEVFNVSRFGSKKTEVHHLDRVQLTIIGEENQYMPIDVLVVPQIGVPIQTHLAEIKQLPHLRYLKLAHTNPSDQPFEIEIPIGADYYWDFIMNHVVRGNGPTAVKSKLRYLLSGPAKNARANTTGDKVCAEMVDRNPDYPSADYGLPMYDYCPQNDYGRPSYDYNQPSYHPQQGQGYGQERYDPHSQYQRAPHPPVKEE